MGAAPRPLTTKRWAGRAPPPLSLLQPPLEPLPRRHHCPSTPSYPRLVRMKPMSCSPSQSPPKSRVSCSRCIPRPGSPLMRSRLCSPVPTRCGLGLCSWRAPRMRAGMLVNAHARAHTHTRAHAHTHTNTHARPLPQPAILMRARCPLCCSCKARTPPHLGARTGLRLSWLRCPRPHQARGRSASTQGSRRQPTQRQQQLRTRQMRWSACARATQRPWRRRQRQP